MKTKAKLTILALLSGVLLLTVPLLGKGKPAPVGGPGALRFDDLPGDVMVSDGVDADNDGLVDLYIDGVPTHKVICELLDYSDWDRIKLIVHGSTGRSIFGAIDGDYILDDECFQFRTNEPSDAVDGNFANMDKGEVRDSFPGVLLFKDSTGEFALHWEECIRIERMASVEEGDQFDAWYVSADANCEAQLYELIRGRNPRDPVGPSFPAPFGFTFILE